MAWDGPQWAAIPAIHLDYQRPEGSSHRPQVAVKLLCDAHSVAVLFRVEDRYVRSVCTEFQGSVCRDSCVEWFVQPRADRGYFNFEVNCGGTLHVSYVEDPTRTPNGFRKFRLLSAADAARLTVKTSMPAVVEPEIAEPTVWTALLRVPFAVLEEYAGPLPTAPGACWRANFYKCGDATSHRHWLAWAPVGELNFHRPQDFAPLLFA